MELGREVIFMHGVSADWNALLTASLRLTTNGTTLNDIITAINTDVTNTQDAWHGQASQAYQEQWATLFPQFQQAAENIITMGTQINNYVRAQQEIENQAQRAYRG